MPCAGTRSPCPPVRPAVSPHVLTISVCRGIPLQVPAALGQDHAAVCAGADLRNLLRHDQGVRRGQQLCLAAAAARLRGGTATGVAALIFQAVQCAVRARAATHQNRRPACHPAPLPAVPSPQRCIGARQWRRRQRRWALWCTLRLWGSRCGPTWHALSPVRGMCRQGGTPSRMQRYAGRSWGLWVGRGG